MALITPDFSDVQESISPGTYKCRIVDAQFAEWAGKDGKPSTPYVKWTCETFAESEDKNNGRKIFNNTAITGKGAFRLQQFYKAAMKQDLKGNFDTETLLGKELQLTVVDGMKADGTPTGYTEVKACLPL